jgi:hypothetical protein
VRISFGCEGDGSYSPLEIGFIMYLCCSNFLSRSGSKSRVLATTLTGRFQKSVLSRSRGLFLDG